jgi:hypothetical protein
MGDVTHEQVNLMLKLYDARREPLLREARDWYMSKFNPQSAEDMARLCPPGSKESAYMRMVVSYWQMAAGIVNRGLIDEDLFFENSGEQWFVWERLKPVVGAMRARYKNPQQFGELEEHVKRFEVWREKRAPGSGEVMRQMIQQSVPQPRTAN